jgi:hypothetical protein
MSGAVATTVSPGEATPRNHLEAHVKPIGRGSNHRDSVPAHAVIFRSIFTDR